VNQLCASKQTGMKKILPKVLLDFLTLVITHKSKKIGIQKDGNIRRNNQ
jgi:hypothetical protein